MKRKPLRVLIDVGTDGMGSVLLNGVDISAHVQSVEIHASAGKTPIVKLELTNVVVAVDGRADVVDMDGNAVTVNE